MILSARAAALLWPRQDPIGRLVQTGGYFGAVSEVIGVVTDSRAVDLTRNDVCSPIFRIGCGDRGLRQRP